ncbi:tetratricopeptide repeat-containing diguanylate cyclase [Chitinimonas koreensis]|uniref:tetratricopeptide repeat-containing diguanylate cyclase n=1 Tax=Chitinimonas koreensis TaxID=356302 RepID=UPI000A0056E1|nr:tetratricopeptide repeat-containing diguanylate cyclase [Chitinimonas koreensis]
MTGQAQVPNPVQETVGETEALNEDAWRLQYGDPQQARALAERAAELARSQGDAVGEAYARLTLAAYQMRHGDGDVALREFQSLQQFFDAREDRRGHMRASFGVSALLARSGRVDESYAELIGLVSGLDEAAPVDAFVIYNAIGATSVEAGLLDEGLRNFYLALGAARQLDSPDHLALVLSNLGDTQHGAGNYEDAIRFLVEADEMVAKSRLAALAPFVASNLAMCQLAIGAHEAAFVTIQPYLELDRDTVRMGRADAAFFRAIAAHTYTANGQWLEARQMVARALEAADQLGDVKIAVHCHWVLGLVERGEGRPAESLVALQKAEALLGPIKDPYYSVQISRELAAGHAALGNWPEAYRYLEQHQLLYQRSLGSAARARMQIARIQSELAEAERERDFALLKQAEAERARAELEMLNRELAAKVDEIERLQTKLREQAIRDPLTDLYNRRYLQEELANEIRLAERRYYPICVVLIDLDHFKTVNDRFGHPVGDRVLIELANLLRANIRGSDFACRFGGEEFCLVLSDIGLEAAMGRMADLLDRFRALVVDLADSQLDRLTFSAGVAAHPHHGSTPDDLLAAADAALYRAKAAGRDRIYAAE